MTAYFGNQVHAQYIDKIINLQTYYLGEHFEVDLDSDGQDDFKFHSIATHNHPVISLHANAKMLVFSANHNKVKVIAPNQSIMASMPGGDFVSQDSALIEQQYTHSFIYTNYQSGGYTSTGCSDGGYIAVMVNNRIGYIVFNATYYTPESPSRMNVYFSRLTDLTSLTTEKNNLPVGIADVVKTNNTFTLTNQHQVLFSEGIDT